MMSNEEKLHRLSLHKITESTPIKFPLYALKHHYHNKKFNISNLQYKVISFWKLEWKKKWNIQILVFIIKTQHKQEGWLTGHLITNSSN